MSVLIKGMEMPTDCDNCSLFDDRFDYPSCNATGHNRGYNWNPRGQRMPDCPLIEVPPHGRLIDADALLADVRAHSESYFADDFAHEWVDVALTVIPAEESNMDSFIRIFEEDDEEDGMDSFIRILKD